MKKRKQYQHRAVVSEQERTPKLAILRMVLTRASSRPLLGELGPALLRMLDGGQIDYQLIDGSPRKKGFAARVTPADIAQLLPLVRYPIISMHFHFFLHGLVYIPRLTGDEQDVPFSFSAALRHSNTDDVSDVLNLSRVPDPRDYRDVARFLSEFALRNTLGFDGEPTPDGWLRLYIGDQSVSVEAVTSRTAPLELTSPDEFKTDIIVLFFCDCSPETVEVIGWTDRQLFLERCHQIGGCNPPRYVLTQADLRPFETLVELANRCPRRSQ